MAYVRVYVWLGNGVANKLGAGHGGAEIQTAEGRKYYISLWNRAGGGSGKPGVVLSQGTEANRRVGFAQIQNNKGQVVANPYAYGTGALCGLHLRRRDGFALRILAAYAKDHLMALAGAVRRRDRGAGVEHRRALAGLLPGLLYGLRAGALPVGAHPSIAMYTNAG